MVAMQHDTEFSWIQVQFLAQSVSILLQARETLMWTYGIAYFLDKDLNSTKIFEDNQTDLEMAVESLSGLLEQDINIHNATSIRQRVLSTADYVSKRREVLLADQVWKH